MDNSTNIYILELTENKWYVGRTSNIVLRYQQHLLGQGSAWTKRYRPLGLHKTIADASIYDEDRYVKEYMALHGIDNVRGGTYCTFDLTTAQKEAIQKEIWAATDCCMRCGDNRHFVKDCTKQEKGNWFQSLVQIVKAAFVLPTKKVPDNACYRCGRTGHWIRQCYATTHIDGRTLSKK